MMMRREAELKELREAFYTYLGSGIKVLTTESGQLQRCLRKVGCSETDVLVGERESDFFGFVKIVDRARSLVRDRMRRHAGFNDAEVAEYRMRFALYDDDGSGDIGGGELRQLLGEILPAAAFSMKHRARLEKLLKEADEDGNGTLDFGDFLRLMRHHHDDCDREELQKIDTAIAETGFSDDEAQQFRTIFEEVDIESAGHISLSSVQKMIHGVCPLYRQHIAELTTIFNEVTGPDNPGEVDFPDFLRVLRKVLDIDLAGIKTWTAAKEA
jgi:calmodulin